MRFVAAIPKIVVALLLVAAIVNLLVGVFLRYVMIEVTDWLDVDPVRFTWVEEVGICRRPRGSGSTASTMC